MMKRECKRCCIHGPHIHVTHDERIRIPRLEFIFTRVRHVHVTRRVRVVRIRTVLERRRGLGYVIDREFIETVEG